MVDIEIDGRSLHVEPNTTIIEAADKVNIYIPRFCYHKKLSIAANCRMCLVEVEKSAKPLPACATPVTAGMKVFTKSAKAKEAQRSVMEFLLINHPLDCPICDQGGECELQDLSLGYGSSLSRFTESKRSVKDDNLGSLIATEMTRCIQCTRCVRFGQEIAGIKELGALNRGENLQISTYIAHSLESELSGNIIDLCPVGALTSKPFRFKARAWELTQSPSIAPHDCLGSNIYVHTRREQLMRVVPRDNEAINETWLSDRDRYSYLGINSKERLTKPHIKENGQWFIVDWPTALAKLVTGFNNVLQKHGPQKMGALASPSSTTEEFYCLQKLWRSLGSPHIDHRLHQCDVSDDTLAPLYPPGLALTELEQASFVLLIGSTIRREQPLAAQRLRKAQCAGANIASIHCIDVSFPFPLHEKIIVHPDELVLTLAGIAKALDHDKQLAGVGIQSSEVQLALAKQLTQAEKPLLILGAVAHNHPAAALIRQLSQFIAHRSGARCVYLTEGANSVGGWLAGAIPHRLAGGTAVTPGLSTAEMFATDLRAYLLLNVEPTLDCANPQAASNALHHAEFVVALSPFKAKSLLEHANMLLPIATFAEIQGSFINMAACWQTFLPAMPPVGEARSACELLQTLGHLLKLPDFSHSDHAFIREQLEPLLVNTVIASQASDFAENGQVLADKLDVFIQNNSINKKTIICIKEWPMYGIDSIVRRSEPLQQAASCDPLAAIINSNLATELMLEKGQWVIIKQGQGSARLLLQIDENIPDHCVWLPQCEATAALGESFGVVEIYAE